MGPRFNGVEDNDVESVTVNAIALQWGHALMAWKTSSGPSFRNRGPRASMGPRFNGVEDYRKWQGALPRLAASMGPRFNGVEDSSGIVLFRLLVEMLQWGHALMAWKTYRSA